MLFAFELPPLLRPNGQRRLPLLGAPAAAGRAAAAAEVLLLLLVRSASVTLSRAICWFNSLQDSSRHAAQ
jgi:hypothetical protein